MSVLENLKKGIQFMVCGEMGEPLRIADRGGETVRFARIVGFGKTYNLPVDSDEELAALPPAGTPVRALGLLGRRSRSDSASARIVNLLTPGQQGWKDLSDEEVLAGARFWGWGMVTLKRETEYGGKSYRSFQIGTFGETFLFRNMTPEQFDTVPESGAVYVDGQLESRLSNSAAGMVHDLALVLRGVSLSGPAQRSGRQSQTEEKQA